ncbi:MAG: phenylalanine--tRNA ligase subunit beta [Deltaproteobacteria bacterium]|nr:MAG: phenylalanine--tRNA ligase subunit beta [Deltaproteobacteria bacterium]
MIVSVNWLREYVDFGGDVDELAHRLTMAGLEVEGIEHVGADLDSVIVARLKSVEKHPEADRLTLCQVDTGSETVQVVCGATNHKTGDLVALAQVGSVLPGDFKIKKSKIRGQVSMGMLCSEKELGLSDESSGIMILPEGLEPGRPVFDALGLKDTRIEIGLTPNRPDCLSILGVAREVAALYGTNLRRPEIALEEAGPSVADLTSVTIEEPEHCPRYMARVVKGVTVGPSPAWLVRKLESIGQRSINNIVDITNLIMFEFGQPMHAFDFDLLRQGRIVVRLAEEGSLFTTLDGQERTLSGTDLVICDGEGPVALAGIMGGENSEINDRTRNILLESACFKPTTVRRTAKRLGIHSESSHRFERGTDINMVPYALDMAAKLVAELAGGEIASGAVDAYPTPFVPQRVELRIERCRQILGLPLTSKDIYDHLVSIGVHCEEKDDKLVCTIPSFRPDLEREIDLVEEVARLAGYDNVPVTMPVGSMIDSKPLARKSFVDCARNSMVELGFNEIVSYSFISPGAYDQLGLHADDARRRSVKILNPLSEDQSVMRTTLVPSMLQTVAGNLAYRSHDLRLFELRPVFVPKENEKEHSEPWRLCLALSGRRAPLGWASGDQDVDFFDLKGVCESLLECLGVEAVRWQANAGETWLHPGQSAQILIDDLPVGVAGAVHPETLQSFDIEQDVFLAELDLEKLLEVSRRNIRFSKLSRYPDTFRDSAVLVADDIPAEKVLEAVQVACPAYAEEVVLFDVYKGQGVPEGQKSLAFRVRYRAQDKTLTDEQIAKAHDRIIRKLEKEFGARVR